MKKNILIGLLLICFNSISQKLTIFDIEEIITLKEYDELLTKNNFSLIDFQVDSSLNAMIIQSADTIIAPMNKVAINYFSNIGSSIFQFTVMYDQIFFSRSNSILKSDPLTNFVVAYFVDYDLLNEIKTSAIKNGYVFSNSEVEDNTLFTYYVKKINIESYYELSFRITNDPNKPKNCIVIKEK